MTTPNNPWSFASPEGGGMMSATIVNINSVDNSVQIRIHGYQDDKGNIPDEGLEWVKVLGQHSGLAGSTSTHPYFPGSKVMVSMSGGSKFVVGSVTGYDSDKTQNQDPTQADTSENTDPNVPVQTRGPVSRDPIPAGTGSDQTSKGTRQPKVDAPFGAGTLQKIFDYAKSAAPFDKGSQSKFPSLKSIGIPLLEKASNVLNTIDGMDGNVSGAIKASTKIIRMMQQSGLGSAASMIGSGNDGPADQAAAQVVQSFGIMQFGELLSALQALLSAKAAVRAATIHSTSESLQIAPQSLVYSTFGVDSNLIALVQAAVNAFDTTVGQPSTIMVQTLQNLFATGFAQAAANATAYMSALVSAQGIAILIAGVPDAGTMLTLIQTLAAVATSAGMPAATVGSIGGGAFGAIQQQGLSYIQLLVAQNQAAITQAQATAASMNTFAPESSAMGEIMGGGASKDESLTGIVMKYLKKAVNQDARGFTKTIVIGAFGLVNILWMLHATASSISGLIA